MLWSPFSWRKRKGLRRTDFLLLAPFSFCTKNTSVHRKKDWNCSGFNLFRVILIICCYSTFSSFFSFPIATKTTLQMSQHSQVRVYITSNTLTCTWTLLMQPRTWLGWRKNRLLILLITKQKRNFSFWDICIVWDMYSYHARLTLSGNSPCIIFPYINISKCITYTVYFGHLINFVLMWLWLPSNMLEVINCYNQI